MPSLAATLKSEIRRLASRELKKALRPLRRIQRQLRGVRLASRGQKRTLARLERRLDRIKTRRGRGAATAATRVPGRRGRKMTPKGILALRSRLHMTRLQFAKLLKVSPGSIFGWETGRTIPRGKNLARISEVRKMGAAAARKVTGRRRKPAVRRRRS